MVMNDLLIKSKQPHQNVIVLNRIVAFWIHRQRLIFKVQAKGYLKKILVRFFRLVMLQPQAAGQPDDRTKHKFMVQWVAVPTNYTEDVDNFVREKKRDEEMRENLIFLVETRFKNSECSRFEIKMYFCG